RIGSMNAPEAMTAVRPYICVNNEMGYLAHGPDMLVIPSILKAIGATPDGTKIEYELQGSDGKTTTARLDPISQSAGGHNGLIVPGFTYLHQRLSGEKPLYLHDLQSPLRFEHDPQHKLAYFWFGAVADAPHETMKDFVARLFELVNGPDVEHLV